MKFQPGVHNASGVHRQFCHLLLIVGAPDFRNCRFSFLVRFYTRLVSQIFKEKGKKKNLTQSQVFLQPSGRARCVCCRFTDSKPSRGFAPGWRARLSSPTVFFFPLLLILLFFSRGLLALSPLKCESAPA